MCIPHKPVYDQSKDLLAMDGNNRLYKEIYFFLRKVGLNIDKNTISVYPTCMRIQWDYGRDNARKLMNEPTYLE